MMSSHRTRRRVAAALAAFAFIAAGCGDDAEPVSDPPPAGYQQPPEDLCEQIRFDEVLRQGNLGEPPSYETPPPDYRTERVWWEVRCKFASVAEDGRFTTELGEFGPRGGLELSIYHEAADAAGRYDDYAGGLFEGEEGTEPVEVTGWWDAGVSVTLTEELDPEDFADLDDFEITSLDARLLVRHENLVALAYMNAAYVSAEDVDEASALLQEILVALLDETVEHLPRTDG